MANIPEEDVAMPRSLRFNKSRQTRNGTPNSGYQSSPQPEELPSINSPSPEPYPARIQTNTSNNSRSLSPSPESVTGEWTEEQAKNWLELSGKKWMRYYHRTQGPNKFKIRKDKSKSKKIKPLGTGSSDSAPMVHPEEIKITVFEYPDPEDGEYKRGPVTHIQSINPFLTATNMLDALKLAIGGDPKIAAHNAELKSAEKEVTRLTKKVESLVKEIESVESKIEEQQNKNLAKIGNTGSIPPGSIKKTPGGIAYTVQSGGTGEEQNKPKAKMGELQEKLATLKNELKATELALKDSKKHLEDLQSKVVKGSKVKSLTTAVEPNTTKDDFVPEKKSVNNTLPSVIPNNAPSGTVKNVTTNNSSA